MKVVDDEFYPDPTPERQLLAAMLWHAFNDLLYARPIKENRNGTDNLYEGRPRQRAYEWFNSTEQKDCDRFTFVETCEYLELPADELRQMANNLHRFAVGSQRNKRRKLALEKLTLSFLPQMMPLVRQGKE